ncbi:MAG TPA: hypothetical protein VFH08_09990, partial [Chitinophagaceae bacterium]|nr:hypothetical protein [Chitinophagaceae bacterium]
SLLPADFKKSMASRYKITAFSVGVGGTNGFVKTGNLIRMPITNRKRILAGVFCLKRPITNQDIEIS